MKVSVTFLECNKEYVGDSVKDKYDEYTLDDCILIRTTDAFPFDRIIETPVHGNAFVHGDSYILGDAIADMIRDKYPDRSINKEAKENFFKELGETKIASKSYRSTIHFTINGLVTSHLYGNFDNRDYTIFEPLKHHIKDSSLLSLDACDTYFNDDMKLSNEAIILIEKKKYEEIKNKEEYSEVLNNMEVYVYTGNIEEAVSIILHDYGYDSFIINNHGYVNGLSDNTGANKMWECLDELRKDYNIEVIPHFDSEFNHEDIKKTSIEGEKSDLENFIYIFDRAIKDNLLDNELVSSINTALELDKDNSISYLKEKNSKYMHYNQDYNEYGKSYLLKIVPTFIEKIGLEKLKQYIKEYNQLYIEGKLDSKQKQK